MEINWKRNSALFLIGQSLSLFGTNVVQYAILWHITLKSQSGSMMAIMTVVGFLPMFFISPFAGVWADKFNRKYIINIADGTVAFFSLIVAIFLLFGIDSYVVLFVCAFVRALGQGVQMPTVNAFIPDIVPQEHLTKINGFQGSIQAVVTLTSPMLGATLYHFAPFYTLFFLDVVTASIGISIVFFFVKVLKKEKAETQTSETKGIDYFREIKDGLKYIRKNAFVFRLIIIQTVFVFLFVPASLLTPLQVVRNFGDDVWRLSAIEITFSVGMLLGGILIGMWGGFKNKIYTLALSCIVCGLLSATLGIMPIFWIYIVIMGLIGLFMSFFNTPAMVLLQTNVEDAFMGRVMSVFIMVSTLVMPLGMIILGPLADIVSINIILIVTGITAMFISIPLLMSKILREAGRSHLQNGENINAEK